MIGLTGSTGHLGQAILSLNPGIQILDRELPTRNLHTIIHTAAPNWRDDTAVHMFDQYNTQLAKYITRNNIRTVVNVGSWWQYATGTCQDLPYTHLKHRQLVQLRNLGIRVINIIPFSIYGDHPRPGRGFIPQLIESIQTGKPLAGLSEQPRDFIHVTDVARACLTAVKSPTGNYVAAHRASSSPKEIANRYGVTAPAYDEHPTAKPRYHYYWVPKWSPRIDLHTHILDAIR